ncbi:transcriptional activator RinB [Staphylococcus epidermidis]|uniref:transcriptional activator RinB n=1 Tax=Staphylococcus epidermidis TaxID=1282 RepID=UPI0021AF969F|nr:transcriptional activator RinB [Staphylococcus epidermidis]
MTKYTCVKSFVVNENENYLPGDIVDIKKMKNPIILKNGKKFNYKETNTNALMSRECIKKHFKKGEYKNGVIKHILKIFITLMMYELGKYLTSLLITILESENDIDAPSDYPLNGDQADLNGVSE